MALQSPMITSELHDLGCKLSENRVAKVMRNIGLSARVYSNQKWGGNDFCLNAYPISKMLLG